MFPYLNVFAHKFKKFLYFPKFDKSKKKYMVCNLCTTSIVGNLFTNLEKCSSLQNFCSQFEIPKNLRKVFGLNKMFMLIDYRDYCKLHKFEKLYRL